MANPSDPSANPSTLASDDEGDGSFKGKKRAAVDVTDVGAKKDGEKDESAAGNSGQGGSKSEPKPFAKNVRWTSQLADLVEIRRRDDANDGRAALSGSGQTRRISWDLSELVISPAGPDRWADVEFPDDGNSRTSGSVHGADDGMNSSIRDPPPPSSASSVSSRRSSGSVSSAASNASSAASDGFCVAQLRVQRRHLRRGR